MNNFRNKQSGFTLIEISFVLLIIGLLIAGALGAKVYINTQKANNESIAYQRVIVSLQDKYKQAYKTTTATTASAIVGNVFDNYFSVDPVGNTVGNQFGGVVTIAPATISTPSDAFLLKTTLIPGAICQKIIPLIQSFVYRIDIGAVTIQATPDAPALVSVADVQCGVAPTADMSLYFAIRP